LEQLANKILIVEQRQTGKQLRMTSNLVLTNENTIGHDGSKLATEGLFCPFVWLNKFIKI